MNRAGMSDDGLERRFEIFNPPTSSEEVHVFALIGPAGAVTTWCEVSVRAIIGHCVFNCATIHTPWAEERPPAEPWRTVGPCDVLGGWCAITEGSYLAAGVVQGWYDANPDDPAPVFAWLEGYYREAFPDD